MALVKFMAKNGYAVVLPTILDPETNCIVYGILDNPIISSGAQKRCVTVQVSTGELNKYCYVDRSHDYPFYAIDEDRLMAVWMSNGRPSTFIGFNDLIDLIIGNQK